jgi:hypothetical protein
MMPLRARCASRWSALLMSPCWSLCLLVMPLQADELNFAALQQMIRSQHIVSIEQLLSALPPTQRSRYALMFESRSLQQASYRDPRVILYSADARFIMTFNGAPQQRGYAALETMEFDPDSKQFLYRELQFTDPAAGPVELRVSDANPERCAPCHGRPARPVWDTHPLWPGAYGERYGSNLSAAERAGLATFLAQQPTHPRYRALLETARFADPETFRPTPHTLYYQARQESPNAELALGLTRLRFESIARMLASSPAFARYQYALLGVADASCGALAEFYPPPLWRAQSQAFDAFSETARRANLRQAQLKMQRVTASKAGLRARDAAASDLDLSPLRFIAESALALSTRAWSLALEQDAYDFAVPPLQGPSLRDALLAEMRQRDVADQARELEAQSVGSDRYCAYLRHASRAALGQTAGDGSALTGAAEGSSAGREPLAAAAGVPASLQLCITCHRGGVGPPLPFADATQLAQALRTQPAPHGMLIDEIRYRLSSQAGAARMPLGINLPEPERQSLETYFVQLAASP